jgi:galactokinase
MDAINEKVKSAYNERFSGNPIWVFAPGRVNLIGEHTDYNLGFVLPAAIDKGITFAFSPNDVGMIRLISVDMQPDYVEIPIGSSYHKTEVHWANYILGVVDELQKDGYQISGFDCTFGADLPIGAGVSSSAALEGGVVFGLAQIFGFTISLLEMTKIAQRAENKFIGVQCGIMDQFASLHGKQNSVIRLDCRSLHFEYYPFESDDVCILLCDTKVRRTLAGSEYNVRRQQCEAGVAILHELHPEINSLRDVSIDLLESHKNLMSDVVYKRCYFVLAENLRVQKACDFLLQNNLVGFGSMMYQSHYGLRDDYEVSCRELDILVDATEYLDGVLGARMMGGGFGGCTINLVKVNELDSIKSHLKNNYFLKTGILPDLHVAGIGPGTHLLP